MQLPASNDEEQKRYNEIKKRRLELEAEFLRIENEYKKILRDIAQYKEEAALTDVKNKIHSIDI